MKLSNTQILIDEINELIQKNLNEQWMASEWTKREKGVPRDKVHPLVNAAYDAYNDIQHFINAQVFDMTPAIWEISELAVKINSLKRNNVKGFQNRLDNLISFDYSLYLTARYEIQIAGMLLYVIGQ